MCVYVYMFMDGWIDRWMGGMIKGWIMSRTHCMYILQSTLKNCLCNKL